jgi:hypothetical protein
MQTRVDSAYYAHAEESVTDTAMYSFVGVRRRTRQKEVESELLGTLSGP